jgi:hypothetical protein
MELLCPGASSVVPFNLADSAIKSTEQFTDVSPDGLTDRSIDDSPDSSTHDTAVSGVIPVESIQPEKNPVSSEAASFGLKVTCNNERGTQAVVVEALTGAPSLQCKLEMMLEKHFLVFHIFFTCFPLTKSLLPSFADYH